MQWFTPNVTSGKISPVRRPPIFSAPENLALGVPGACFGVSGIIGEAPEGDSLTVKGREGPVGLSAAICPVLPMRVTRAQKLTGEFERRLSREYGSILSLCDRCG